MRQFAIYAEAYSLINMVYDAYEEVYGKNSLLEQRDAMMQRLYDVDLYGEVTGNSVMDQYLKFFDRDQYTFVNCSNRVNLKLSSAIRVPSYKDFQNDYVNNGGRYSTWERTPAYMKKNPMSESQIKSLANYCAKKKVSLFDFLFNQMEFQPLTYIKVSGQPTVARFAIDYEVISIAPPSEYTSPRARR